MSQPSLMERIKTYTHGDLVRVTHDLQKVGRKTGPDFFVNMYGASALGQEAIAVSQQMRETHQEWVERKIAKLRPYLPSTGHQTSDVALTQHYKEGLQKAVTALQSHAPQKKIDLQDAVAGYTSNFFAMLQTCARIGISPNTAGQFAEESYKMDRRKIIQLFEANPELPKTVVERAALLSKHGRPRVFLDKYRRAQQRYESLSTDPRFKDLSQDNLFYAASEDLDAEELLKRNERKDTYLTERQQKPNLYVEGVPAIKQRHKNWCGYASLAMLLQFHGYNDITPERLFKQEFGHYDPLLEYLDPSRGPSIDTLALLVKELTPLTVRVVTQKDYRALKERSPNLAKPRDVLQTFLKKNVPVIIRQPKHFVVVTGYDAGRQEYTINDPMTDHERSVGALSLEQAWRSDESSEYQHDTRNLMMVITPPRRVA
jgi:hypothetical protein